MRDRDISKGYGMVTKVAMQDRELPIQAKGIYAYMCSFAGGKDEAHPSLSRITYDLDMDRKTVQKHIKTLVDKGYIEVDRGRYVESKKFAPNYYTILK